LPTRIRTDNGVPFATTTLARLSALSGWWLRLGVMPELIEPGKPQQNASHEHVGFEEIDNGIWNVYFGHCTPPSC
jgi:putative transposase